MFMLMHIIHLLTVILWIGGLAFVTVIMLPIAINTKEPLQKVLSFQRVEHRFAKQARIYNVITGASGFVMLYINGWHHLLFTRQGLALTVMTMIWVFWFVMLWGLEPLIIRKMLDKMMKGEEKMDIDGVFRKMVKLHWVMMAVSLVAAAAGALTAHGYPII
ncbi:MAG: hypothetical protein HZB85_01675 [Deltaproteobacteria bacterium]|nr:hypothetical protein [Deltaproteobacteria bacterium]